MRLSKRILVSITGQTNSDWKAKLQELEQLKIKKCALFLECYNKTQRKQIYKALSCSNITKIPFVHARHDMTKQEYLWLIENFKTKYFNLHASLYKQLPKLKGLHKKLLLELSYHNNFPIHHIKMKQIAGFCIDLSHFKASEQRHTSEFEFIIKKRKIHKYFKANHLNGYSYSKKKDLHTIRSLKNFNYLKSLPNFIFGKYIAIETKNSINEQLKFKKHIIKILRKKN